MANGGLSAIALRNGGEIIEDNQYMMVVKEGPNTVERSGAKGGKLNGDPVDQEIVVNVYDGSQGEVKLIKVEQRHIPHCLGASPFQQSLSVPEIENTCTEIETEKIKDIPVMPATSGKKVTIETSDMEMRVEFEDMVYSPDSPQACIIYNPQKQCSLPLRGRKVRILADDLPPFSAVYEGVDFEIPKSNGMRARLLVVCND